MANRTLEETIKFCHRKLRFYTGNHKEYNIRDKILASWITTSKVLAPRIVATRIPTSRVMDSRILIIWVPTSRTLIYRFPTIKILTSRIRTLTSRILTYNKTRISLILTFKIRTTKILLTLTFKIPPSRIYLMTYNNNNWRFNLCLNQY